MQIKFKKLCKLDWWGLKIFWLIKFGKVPCFENIFFVPVHRAKGDSTLQHIPAELQRSGLIAQWVFLEKIHIQPPFIFLPAPTSCSLHLLSHICLCTKSHRGTFQHQVTEFALYHLLQISKRIHARKGSKENECKNPGLSDHDNWKRIRKSYVLAKVLWNL